MIKKLAPFISLVGGICGGLLGADLIWGINYPWQEVLSWDIWFLVHMVIAGGIARLLWSLERGSR
jgi:hypothetical protein